MRGSGRGGRRPRRLRHPPGRGLLSGSKRPALGRALARFRRRGLLGAPGSGKSAIVPRLRELLPDRVVLDWDALTGPAADLARTPIPQAPHTWEPYGRLVRAVVDLIHPNDVVVLGVCTPEEMVGWPEGRWLLLDCSDEVRRQRLTARGEPDDIDAVLGDAAGYRALALPVVDTTHLRPDDVASAVADTIIEIAWGRPESRD